MSRRAAGEYGIDGNQSSRADATWCQQIVSHLQWVYRANLYRTIACCQQLHVSTCGNKCAAVSKTSEFSCTFKISTCSITAVSVKCYLGLTWNFSARTAGISIGLKFDALIVRDVFVCVVSIYVLILPSVSAFLIIFSCFFFIFLIFLGSEICTSGSILHDAIDG